MLRIVGLSGGLWWFVGVSVGLRHGLLGRVVEGRIGIAVGIVGLEGRSFGMPFLGRREEQIHLHRRRRFGHSLGLLDHH